MPVTQVTRESLDKVFVSASRIQLWLAACARIIAGGATPGMVASHRETLAQARRAAGQDLRAGQGEPAVPQGRREDSASAPGLEATSNQPAASYDEALADGVPPQHVRWETPMGLPAMQPYSDTVCATSRCQSAAASAALLPAS